MRFLAISEILDLHQRLIATSGGATGVRDLGVVIILLDGLESAPANLIPRLLTGVQLLGGALLIPLRACGAVQHARFHEHRVASGFSFSSSFVHFFGAGQRPRNHEEDSQSSVSPVGRGLAELDPPVAAEV